MDIAGPGGEIEGVVLVLEKCLEMARDGEFVSVAVAAVQRDGSASTAWDCNGVHGSPMLLVGTLDYLKNRIMDAKLKD